MNRRTLLIMLLFSGCATKVPTPAPVAQVNTLSSDINLATNGAVPLVKFASTASSVEKSVQQEIQDLLSVLQDALAEILKDLDNAMSTGYVKEAVDALNAIVDVAATISIIPEPYLAILQALVILLPIIEAEANMTSIPKPTTISVPATMTADSARLILRSASVTH